MFCSVENRQSILDIVVRNFLLGNISQLQSIVENWPDYFCICPPVLISINTHLRRGSRREPSWVIEIERIDAIVVFCRSPVVRLRELYDYTVVLPWTLLRSPVASWAIANNVVSQDNE